MCLPFIRCCYKVAQRKFRTRMTSNKRDEPPSPWPPSTCEQGPEKTCVYYKFLEGKECLVCPVRHSDKTVVWILTELKSVREQREAMCMCFYWAMVPESDRRSLTKGSAVDGRGNGFMMLTIHRMRGWGGIKVDCRPPSWAPIPIFTPFTPLQLWIIHD